MLAKFDCVSLREKTSIPLVESLYHKKVIWCIDLTLLLEADDYEKLITQDLATVTGDYIYVYLFKDDERAYDLVNRYSRHLELPVVCQCNSPHKNRECENAHGR